MGNDKMVNFVLMKKEPSSEVLTLTFTRVLSKVLQIDMQNM